MINRVRGIGKIRVGVRILSFGDERILWRLRYGRNFSVKNILVDSLIGLICLIVRSEVRGLMIIVILCAAEILKVFGIDDSMSCVIIRRSCASENIVVSRCIGSSYDDQTDKDHDRSSEDDDIEAVEDELSAGKCTRCSVGSNIFDIISRRIDKMEELDAKSDCTGENTDRSCKEGKTCAFFDDRTVTEIFGHGAAHSDKGDLNAEQSDTEEESQPEHTCCRKVDKARIAVNIGIIDHADRSKGNHDAESGIDSGDDEDGLEKRKTGSRSRFIGNTAFRIEQTDSNCDQHKGCQNADDDINDRNRACAEDLIERIQYADLLIVDHSADASSEDAHSQNDQTDRQRHDRAF